MSKNFRMKESFVKYLAGVIDADGCLRFVYGAPNQINQKYRVNLELSIQASIAIDRNWKMLKTICKETGVGHFRKLAQRSNDPDRNPMAGWYVTKRSSFETLLPRIIKHSVIKGGHFQRLLNVYRKMKGRNLTLKQINSLRNYSKKSRELDSNPRKSKKHPTWAWTAGYLDGDGCFFNKYYPKRYTHAMSVSVTCNPKDQVGIQLLKKAFKGNIYTQGKDRNVLQWVRNLGFGDYSFVQRFLPKLINYSIIKKYKMEQILAVHNQRRQQRLIEKTPKGEDTVQHNSKL